MHTSSMMWGLRFFSLIIFCLLFVQLQGQKGPWKSKKCAVVLTYDDALNVHLDNAIPSLDSLGMKATFYLSAYFPGCRARIQDWRKAALTGHELGNHTLFHPCIGNAPGREWVSAERDLSKYSMQRILEEIRMTNVFLEALDGKSRRTFAFPCGDTQAGDSSYLPAIKGDFAGARGVNGVFVPINVSEFYNVGSFAINGHTGEQMIRMVKEAMSTNALIVFLFHGVGGEHPLNVGLKEHRELLKFLKQNEKDIWIAPFLEVIDYMRDTSVKK